MNSIALIDQATAEFGAARIVTSLSYRKLIYVLEVRDPHLDPYWRQAATVHLSPTGALTLTFPSHPTDLTDWKRVKGFS